MHQVEYGMTTRNSVQRKVRKGEKGITIFAPMFRKKDSEDGEEGLVGFKTVHVFDISQTEGKNLSCKELEGTSEFVASPGLDVEELTRRLLSACPVPVVRKSLTGMRGYYDPAKKLIALDDRLEKQEIPRTLIHEIAHCLAIRTGEHRAEAMDDDRPMGEVVAEAAAFIALNHFGLDTGSISFGYVAGWGKDIKKVITWGTAAMRVANGLIDLVEGREQKAA